MMHQPVENTAYCLNCANEWPVAWAYKEITGVCPECGWSLGILIELVSSGWWTVWEHDAADASAHPPGVVQRPHDVHADATLHVAAPNRENTDGVAAA